MMQLKTAHHATCGDRPSINTPFRNDPDLGATIRQVGGEEPVYIGKRTIVGCPVLRAEGSPIPSLVAMEPPQEQVWWHQLQSGRGGDDLAKWEEWIHRNFYHPGSSSVHG
jgi:hypothetical protein